VAPIPSIFFPSIFERDLPPVNSIAAPRKTVVRTRAAASAYARLAGVVFRATAQDAHNVMDIHDFIFCPRPHKVTKVSRLDQSRARRIGHPQGLLTGWKERTAKLPHPPDSRL